MQPIAIIHWTGSTTGDSYQCQCFSINDVHRWWTDLPLWGQVTNFIEWLDRPM